MTDPEHELFIWRRGWEDTYTATGIPLADARALIDRRLLLLALLAANSKRRTEEQPTQ